MCHSFPLHTEFLHDLLVGHLASLLLLSVSCFRGGVALRCWDWIYHRPCVHLTQRGRETYQEYWTWMILNSKKETKSNSVCHVCYLHSLILYVLAVVPQLEAVYRHHRRRLHPCRTGRSLRPACLAATANIHRLKKLNLSHRLWYFNLTSNETTHRLRVFVWNRKERKDRGVRVCTVTTLVGFLFICRAIKQTDPKQRNWGISVFHWWSRKTWECRGRPEDSVSVLIY